MTVIIGKCKDCGFFKDCPIDYECPGVEILHEITKREGAIFMVHHGAIIGIASPMTEEEEE